MQRNNRVIEALVADLYWVANDPEDQRCKDAFLTTRACSGAAWCMGSAEIVVNLPGLAQDSQDVRLLSWAMERVDATLWFWFLRVRAIGIEED